MANDSRLALQQRRDEMLLLSERCFTSALGIEDGEAWLHHYILGKISEKLKKPPGVYLEHYQQVRIKMRNSMMLLGIDVDARDRKFNLSLVSP